MPDYYYEFYNLPNVPGWDNAPKDKTGESARQSSPSPYSETADDRDVWINYSMYANPNTQGFGSGGTGPQHVQCSISRRVKTHSNEVGKRSKNIQVGDLLLYRIALLSLKRKGWICATGKKKEWPRAYIEIINNDGVVLKLDMARLVINRWSLEIADEGAGEIFETMHFRAWVAELSRASGDTIEMVLGDSDK